MNRQKTQYEYVASSHHPRGILFYFIKKSKLVIRPKLLLISLFSFKNGFGVVVTAALVEGGVELSSSAAVIW